MSKIFLSVYLIHLLYYIVGASGKCIFIYLFTFQKWKNSSECVINLFNSSQRYLLSVVIGAIRGGNIDRCYIRPPTIFLRAFNIMWTFAFEMEVSRLESARFRLISAKENHILFKNLIINMFFNIHHSLNLTTVLSVKGWFKPLMHIKWQ